METKDRKIEIDELHKEIDLIQGCINRMANNSFMLKGWLVSLVAVIIALLPEDFSKGITIITIIVTTITFWGLDAYYLRMEKLYRKMYEWTLSARNKGKRDYQYDLNPHRFDNQVECTLKIMFSKTLRWFYGILIALIMIIIIYYLWPCIVKLICKC